MLKKFVGLLLAVATIFNVGTVVFAEDNSESAFSTDGYVLVQQEIEDIGDGMFLEKTLEEKMPLTRAGFSGTRTARAKHSFKLKSSGEVMGEVIIDATFSSTPGMNECYIDSYNYTFNEYNTSKITFSLNGEETWNNEGLGILNKYSKYELKYRSIALLAGTDRSMWVKCESNGSTFTSGDKTYN